MGVRLIGDSKFIVGVNVSVNGLSLCVRDYQPIQDVLCLSQYDIWDRLQALWP